MALKYIPNHKAHEDYYREQATQIGSGPSLRHFTGSRIQYGSGLSSILSGIARFALPILKNNVHKIGQVGAKVASDIISANASPGESLKKHATEAVKDIVTSEARKRFCSDQTGQGVVRRNNISRHRRGTKSRGTTLLNKKQPKKRRSRKDFVDDIF